MNLYLEIIISNIKKLGISDINILDVGCGNGGNVQLLKELGYNAFGIDVAFKEGPYLNELVTHGLIRKIIFDGEERRDLDEKSEYVWPNFGLQFDLIASRAVIEHVKNLDQFVLQLSTHLKEGSFSIHYYPSKYSLIECHTGVPFGAFFKSRTYYSVMCGLGLCFKRYRGAGADAYCYMVEYTEYRNERDISAIFARYGLLPVIDFKDVLDCHPSVILAVIRKVPGVRWAFSLLRSRVAVFQKTSIKVE